MSIPFSRAPHIEGAGYAPHTPQAPNAALLIDFDNVTMGMRSDLSKELKTLLASDVIRGKVTVQRAYADWRRYPQYIVPLSEASIDLIFAPAYGSSKKNATDIRMAIDGIELVFTRPEIGTYILLTGDSDFSSLVLKLKEYGKYVIGVGIQESSSDILVQNCDEYYSYTSLSGLRKTDEVGASPSDPWALVERAVEQMSRRGDVMRSDRLKQVMLEIDPNFDEKAIGFNKFSRFLSEAGKKGLLQLQKMENGQYEIVAGKGSRRSEERKSGNGEGRRGERSRSGRGRSGSGGADAAREADRTSRGPEAGPPAEPTGATPEGPAPQAAAHGSDDLAAAYTLLRRAISDLLEDEEGDAVRDSDVKRRMLALEASFDEGTLGFPKFSRFLRQAHEHEVVELRTSEGGMSHVALGARTAAPDEGTVAPTPSETREAAGAGSASASERSSAGAAGPDPRGAPVATAGGRLRPRETPVSGRPGGDEPPPLFEGQVVARPSRTAGAREAAGSDQASETPKAGSPGTPIDPAELRLPRGSESVIQYLSNSYGGVGKKTAETLVEAFGDDLFLVLQTDPAKVEALLPPARAEKFLEGWNADFARRRDRLATGGPAHAAVEDAAPTSEIDGPEEAGASAPRGGRTRRTRGGR